MKVESILIKNFKRFEHLEVSFKNQTLNAVSNRFLVLGDNGNLSNDTHVTLLQVSKNGKWQRVTTQNGTSGWVWAEFVK